MTSESSSSTSQNASQSDSYPTDQSPKTEVANGTHITVYFDGTKCIHSRHCVTLAPKVFHANTPGEWIFPDEMGEMDLIATIERCPSGALQYERKKGKQEQNPLVNTIKVFENGPNAFHAELEINGKRVGERRTLCRCGQSKNKPYCDNSHLAANFVATGQPASQSPIETLTQRDGVLNVEPQENGPNKVVGNVEICCGSGRVIQRTTTTYLCRCGASANKPFCDGSHAKIGFQAPA